MSLIGRIVAHPTKAGHRNSLGQIPGVFVLAWFCLPKLFVHPNFNVPSFHGFAILGGLDQLGKWLPGLDSN